MLTREEFQPIYEQGSEAVWTLLEALQRSHATLETRVKQLEDRLGKDSHNSNKPPSSDGYHKKPVSLRENTGRKPEHTQILGQTDTRTEGQTSGESGCELFPCVSNRTLKSVTDGRTPAAIP